jgi:hypothetical protein
LTFTRVWLLCPRTFVGGGSEDRVEISHRLAIFIGFKMDGQMRRRMETIEGPDRKYVSREDSTFLRICKMGEDTYVGKVIHEPLSTDRVDDVRRNILSILQRLCPDTRLPTAMEIMPCVPEAVETPGMIESASR